MNEDGKPSAKRPRQEEWIRLSDGYTRTEINVICPVMKAENSVRVFYRLQKEMLTEAIKSAGNSIGLTYEDIQFVSRATSMGTESNLFIKFKNPLPNDENLSSRFKEGLKGKLPSTMVKNILVEKVEDTSQTIPQPLISEHDFEMHKLRLCLREVDRMKEESPERLDLWILGENIESNLNELSNSYTNIAMLSQNGKGKSFLLNLLMLMTADNEEEYSENNRNLQVPNDLPDNILVKNLTDTYLENLPVVVKEFLKNIKDDSQDVQSLLQPICHQLKNVTNINTALNGLSDIGDYFAKRQRLNIQPYFLSQKKISRGYESTTKCIFHLRYGTLYEMKVEYFNESELQQQLYELVTMGKDCKDEEIEDKAQECLTERFKILTGQSFSEDMKDMFNGPDDITFLPEVLKFVGKTVLYFGQGKNPTHDRLALQTVLQGLTTAQASDEDGNIISKRIAAVKKIVVYLPCKILYGGKEILEMPGTDDSDPIALDCIARALDKVDAVMLLTEHGFTLCEKEVKHMLSKSRFFQRFKEHANKYRVMLLTYPEKITEYQFAPGDEMRINSLEENKKRKEELKQMKKILKLDTLTNSLEERISTSYIFPVLHTSILAQEQKPEYKVISRYGDTFLKYTGVQNLIVNLDELVLSSQKTIFQEVRREISYFQDEVEGCIDVEDARSIVQSLSVRSTKSMLEDELSKRFQKLDTDLDKKIKNMLSKETTEIWSKFDMLVQQAIERWDQIEPKVKSIGVFSPYFCGKNPLYQVCLYYILFEDLENVNLTIFKRILEKIETFLQEYKNAAIEQCTKELNTMLGNVKRPSTATSQFVRKAIGDQLADALRWYEGKKHHPFNEKSMEKCMEDKQKKSLRDIILIPNFKKCSVEEAKIKTRKDIRECMENVYENVIEHLFGLHHYRFKRLSKKLWMPNQTPRIWQQLILHLKSLCKDARAENCKEDINNLSMMINASFI